MRTEPILRCWEPNAVASMCGVLLALQMSLPAADLPQRLDAPGPGYREQSWRLQKSPGPEYLRPLTDVNPTSPKTTFDGEVPLRVAPLLPRGEFKEFEGNLWEFGHRGKIDYGIPQRSEPVLEKPAFPFWEEPLPLSEAIRLPSIPKVILTVPAAVDSGRVERVPFAEPLQLELRPR